MVKQDFQAKKDWRQVTEGAERSAPQVIVLKRKDQNASYDDIWPAEFVTAKETFVYKTDKY